MKSIKFARGVLAIFMVSMLVVMFLTAFVVTVSAQNCNAQEVGDAIYRDLKSVGGVFDDHAGIYYGYVGGDPSDCDNHEAIHINGSKGTVTVVSMTEFIGGRPKHYHGAYTAGGTLPFQTRQSIINTAYAMRDIPFVACCPALDVLMPDWSDDYWDGSIADILKVRCDCVVEYSYEANGITVWDGDISEPIEHGKYNLGMGDLKKHNLDPPFGLTPRKQRLEGKLSPSQPENPTKVSNLHSPSHYDAIGQWNDPQSRNNTIEIAWTDATDVQSGLWGYYSKWDHQPDTEPTWEDTKINLSVETNTSHELEGGDDWYFHIRSVDNAGNWDDSTAHLGPFYICSPPPFLTFTIHKAGKTGTLTLTYYNKNGNKKIKSWKAYSGFRGLRNRPDYECVEFGGPIPHNGKKKYYVNYIDEEDKWPVNNGGMLACQRNDFTIHVGGKEYVTWGCIAVIGYEDFKKTLKEHWPKPKDKNTIELKVEYPDGAYECEKDKKGYGKGKCCEEGPWKRVKRGKYLICQKGFCPETPEQGCCQYGAKCYDNFNECKECFEGNNWTSGGWCNEKKDECVPEASTLVVVAVGLLFLAGYVRLLRRKPK